MIRLARAALWIGVLMTAAIGSAGAGAGGGPPEGFIYQSIEVGGRVYPYTVYRPRGLDAERPVRALIFLHGRGECGVDGSKPLAVGLGPRLLWEPERWPFVVLFPQKPDGESEWEDHDRAVLAMLDRAIVEHNIDPGRVAITGLSQGGHGTIQIAARHPGRFRAAAPVCGYIERAWREGQRVERGLPGPESSARLVGAFRSTPVWLLHGGRDEVVPPIESETLHKILVGGGVDAKLTIFPDDGHNSWDSAYGRSGLWEWLVEMTK